MASVGPYRALVSVAETTGLSTALIAGNAHAHYIFGLYVAPLPGNSAQDARLSAAQSTSAAVALIAGSTASTDTIMLKGIHIVPVKVDSAQDVRLTAAQSTSAAVQLIAGTTQSTDVLMLRSIYITQSTLSGDIALINGSSTGSTLVDLNVVAGTSPYNGFAELPGVGMEFNSSAGLFYQSTALIGITVFYSTGSTSIIDASVALINGSSTGSTLAVFVLPAGSAPQVIQFPGAGMEFGSSAGLFAQSTALMGITAFYSTGVADASVALVNGSSTGSTLASFILPPGAPPQVIQFPLGAMEFNSTRGVYLEAVGTYGVSAFYSTL